MAKYVNKSKILGKIGTENYRVSNCPCHIPKENIKFFKAMQDAGNKDPFSTLSFNNQVTTDWKKSIYENVMQTVAKEVKKALNEGAWGYKPEESDSYLDYSHDLGEPVVKIILKNLKQAVNEKNDDKIYSWLGLFLDMLKVPAFDESWLYSKKHADKSPKCKLVISAFEYGNKGFDYLLSDDKNKMGWKEFDKYKKNLKKMHDEFKLLEMYYNTDEEDPKEAEKLIRESCNFDFNTGFIFEEECGGCAAPYNTPLNTVGVGNIVPAGTPAMSSAAQTSDMFNGSGDTAWPKANKKKKSKTTYFPIASKK